MMVAVRTLFQRVEALGRQWWMMPGVRQWARALGLTGGGFLLSAAGLRSSPQPIALGLILRFTNWQSLCVCLGSMAGYRLFWGSRGEECLWWALAAGLLALLALPRKVLPTLGLLAVGIVKLLYSGYRDPLGFLLALAAAWGSAWAFQRQDRTGRWLRCGLWTLALAQAAPRPWLGLGYGAAGMLVTCGSFPAAAMAGLGLDLARITPIPMTGVLTVSWLGKLLPGSRKFRWLLPGAGALASMAAMGIWDWTVLPGLLLGGGIGMLLPSFPAAQPRRGDTGPAQVRLELAAEAMAAMQQGVLRQSMPPIDREALLQRVRSRSCGECVLRKTCREQERLTVTVLEDTHPFPCRKPGLLRPELTRAREQLRLIAADRRRREEYRLAMAGQYRYTGAMLRRLADGLPRGQPQVRRRYGVTVALRTRGKERSNGDRWAAFPADGGKYYLLLCDGMGTGAAAGEAGKSAAVLLRQLLTAGASPGEAMGSLNAMLTLGGQAGAVTVDMAQIRLDTGQVRLYKWGAAPSWRMKGGKAEKIGTATPPPGLSIGSGREWQGRLSLREGLLIFISDGVDGEEIPRRLEKAADAPPGELAERLLEGETGDDATAAVVRLYPLGPKGS